MFKRGYQLALNDIDAGTAVGASAGTPGENLKESCFTPPDTGQSQCKNPVVAAPAAALALLSVVGVEPACGSFAVVIPEPTTRLFGEPFPRLIRGISEVLFVHDLQLVLLTPQSETDEARVGRYLAAGHVDGVLLVSLHGDDPFRPSLSSAIRRSSWVPVRHARRRRPASPPSQPGADPSSPGGHRKWA